jgi:hypothetical protein
MYLREAKSGGNATLAASREGKKALIELEKGLQMFQ